MILIFMKTCIYTIQQQHHKTPKRTHLCKKFPAPAALGDYLRFCWFTVFVSVICSRTNWINRKSAARCFCNDCIYILPYFLLVAYHTLPFVFCCCPLTLSFSVSLLCFARLDFGTKWQAKQIGDNSVATLQLASRTSV